MKSKIYTKTGDTGETSLIGGKRVLKCNPRVEAYGTVDELIAVLGVLRSYPIDENSQENILRIQKQLFVVGSCLATLNPDHNKLNKEEINFLESEIDSITDNLQPIKDFIIPGGHFISAQCNFARTICRRVERKICEISSKIPVEKEILVYINRLSDYLFVLARFFSKKFEENENLFVSKFHK